MNCCNIYLFVNQHAHCGTFIGFHVDLQGKELPAVGQKIEARLCGSHDMLQKYTTKSELNTKHNYIDYISNLGIKGS